MSNKHRKFMVQILEDLTRDEMRKLKSTLNTEMNERIIPQSDLQDFSPENVARLLEKYHCPKHLEALRDALDDIPRKDLVEKVSAKIDAANKEYENQTEEVDSVPEKKIKSTELPRYEGTFRLSDMVDYATKNQVLLIKKFEEHLEPSAFKILKEELATKTLKNAFSFTGLQYYDLVRKQDLKNFVNDVTAGKKSQKIPPKILDVLFSSNKNNRKRKVVDQIQNDDIHHKLEFTQQESQPREKKPIISNPSVSISEHKSGNEKKDLPANNEEGNTQTPKEDTIILNPNVKYDKDEPENEKKESPVNKELEDCQGSITDTNPQGVHGKYDEQARVCQSKKDAYNANKKTDKKVPENEEYEVLARAIRKHYKEKEYCFDLTCISEHQKYKCFIVQNVLLFKLAEEKEYRILQSLQDEKDLTSKGLPRKNVEFELQFNMAVLQVQSSELISDNKFLRTEAHSFQEYEEFLEKIVSVIVLPVLALYKKVKLDALQNPGTTKNILLPGGEQQIATQSI